MVAPYDIGDPVRSYVRVPGSGTDPTAKSLCCDLSHVSTLAASAPVVPSHVQGPQTSTTEDDDVARADKDEPGNEQIDPKKETTPKKPNESGGAQPSSPEDVQSTHNRANVSNSHKRAHQEETDKKLSPTKHARFHSQEGKAVGNDDDVGVSNSSVGINTVSCVKPSLSIGTQTAELLTQVIMERNQLRERNILLEQKLSVFKDIFKDKKRLTQLVKALNEQECKAGS